jgi:hypothetical protein
MCVYGHVVKSNNMKEEETKQWLRHPKCFPSQPVEQGRGRATQLEDMKPKHLYTSNYLCPP